MSRTSEMFDEISAMNSTPEFGKRCLQNLWCYRAEKSSRIEHIILYSNALNRFL